MGLVNIMSIKIDKEKIMHKHIVTAKYNFTTEKSHVSIC